MMTYSVFDINTNEFLYNGKTEPICGEDFCDTCGDCLVCYWEDDCIDGNCHYWVKYIDEIEP